MAENTEATEVNTTTEPQEPAQAERQYTEVEQQALEQGWVPEDQYKGPGKWRTAEDFLDRGEFFKKIEAQNNKLKTYEQTINELKKHYANVQKTEYERALATLKAEKKAALVEGDPDAVVDIDDKIAALREEQRNLETQPAQVQVDTTPNPTFIAWVGRNPWYNHNRAMKVFADEVGNKLALAGASPTEILGEVERRVKKEFPEQFTNPNREKPGSVESGGSKGSQAKSNFQLTDEETRVMNRFVRAGILTKEQYIADIKASRGE